MKRLSVSKRKNWEERCEEVGFNFHSIGGTYWNEGFCYEFTSDEIDFIEEVTDNLYEMCLKAVDYVVSNDLFSRIGIKNYDFIEFIRDSWSKDEPSIYGRFDLAYNGKDIKLLEFNADTPTALPEASIIQWMWLEDLFPDYDQFNSIHEKLIEGFKLLKHNNINDMLHFSCIRDNQEDLYNTRYLMDVASQTGIETDFIFIEDIGLSNTDKKFYDMYERQISAIFKLYPWEWLIKEDFGQFISKSSALFIEPAWKIILSSKGILPILWEMFPDNPYLLETYSDSKKLEKRPHIKKPFFSREGSNIELININTNYSPVDGGYGIEGFVYQERFDMPCFKVGNNKNYPVIGSWIINNLPAGIGIREDDSPVTLNTSRFVPHYFI
jgi:glutathionylspermidine synthase